MHRSHIPLSSFHRERSTINVISLVANFNQSVLGTIQRRKWTISALVFLSRYFNKITYSSQSRILIISSTECAA